MGDIALLKHTAKPSRGEDGQLKQVIKIKSDGYYHGMRGLQASFRSHFFQTFYSLK